MPATKRGIYHNLKESKYTISNKEIVFFFSSQQYMLKFLNKYKENRINYQKKLDTQFLNLDTVADIHLYLEIEKRGYRACLKGVDINKKILYNYSLRQMVLDETPDWEIIERPKLKQRVKQILSNEIGC